MQPFSTQQHALLSAVRTAARGAGVDVYVVGGVVRDLLRGHIVGEKDFDFMVAGDAAAFAKMCRSFTGGEVREFPDFLTAKIVGPEKITGLAEIDFASSRTETYARPGSLPTVRPGSLDEDLRRRDFTINALALPLPRLCEWVEAGAGDHGALRAVVVDQHAGLKDLDERSIRILHPDSFRDDPTRIFRAVRYAVRLEGVIEPATAAALRGAVNGGGLKTVSPFRVVNELKKISAETEIAEAFGLLEGLGVLGALGLTPAPGMGVVEHDLKQMRTSGVPAAHRFEVVMRILFAHLAGDRAGVFTELGFGKKQVRRFEAELDATSEGLRGANTSIAAIWHGVVRGVIAAGAAEAILRSRGEG